MSPTQHQARVYMGNSEPYTYWVESVILYKIPLRRVNLWYRSKNSTKKLCQMDDSKRGKENKSKSIFSQTTFGIMCGVVEEYER